MNVFSTLHHSRRRPGIDEVNRTMGYVEPQDLGKPCVHIIDREADSLLLIARPTGRLHLSPI